MRIVALCIGVVALAASASGQTVYSGYDVAFSKAGFANPTLPANQDQLTANVAITRANTQGIYNIFQEASYSTNVSPSDTEWSFGTTANFNTLTYLPWQAAVNSNPPASVGQNMVVHLITDDIYLDIRFTAWGQGGGAGGSFSYVRSTIPAPGVAALLPVGALVMTRRRR